MVRAHRKSKTPRMGEVLTVGMEIVKDERMMIHISEITARKLEELGEAIVKQARANIAKQGFENATGEMSDKIRMNKTGLMSVQIETYSGHASFIELGTTMNKGPRPFLWPAYRSEKRKLFSGGKWV